MNPSNPPFLRDGADNAQSEKRWGPLRWWLNLTAPKAAPARTLNRVARERLRRAELTSVVALFVLLLPALLAQQALVDPVTAGAVIGVEVITLIALAFNRLGRQSTAAVLLVLGMDIVIEGSLLTAHGGLGAAWLPTFDLFVASIIAVGILLSPRFIWVFAALHVGLILGDYYLLPHTPDLVTLIQVWGEGVAFQRAVMLQLIGAVLGFVAARSVDLAIRRADRAEEVAALEHSIAEQKRQLDLGIQQLLQTHVRAANGDFGARAPLSQENVLWQIASSLNNLLARMQRAAQADHQLARTEEELRRIAAAIDDAQAGRMPLWPAPTGTAADLILERIARGQRRRSVPSTGFDQGRAISSGQTPASQGWPSLSSQPLGQSPYGPPPSSQPLGPSPFGPGPSSQPAGQPGQSPYGADAWPPPAAPQSGPMEPPPPSPWIIPAELPQQPEPPR